MQSAFSGQTGNFASSESGTGLWYVCVLGGAGDGTGQGIEGDLENPLETAPNLKFGAKRSISALEILLRNLISQERD